MLGAYGSTLTDLGNNAAAGDALENQRMAALNQFLIADRELKQRQRQSDQQNDLARNQLMQQGRIADMQWNTPNATSVNQFAAQRDVAKMPWTMGITPEQAAQNDLARESLKNQFAIANKPYEAAANGIPMGNGPLAQAYGQIAVDKAARAEKMDSALKAANAQYLSTIPTFWQLGGWFRPGNEKQRHAASVISGLQATMPEAGELIFDEKANGGQGGFVSQDGPAANPFSALRPPTTGSTVNSVANPTNPPAAVINPPAANPFRFTSNAPAMTTPAPITATHPLTGQKLVLVNGQWQPAQ